MRLLSYSRNALINARTTMSKKERPIDRSLDLQEVKVDVVRHKERRNTHTAASYDGVKRGIPKVSSRSNDFAYVNSAYVGSLDSVHENRNIQPITGVYREQYWTCSKWSFAKRVLALVVGAILGASIGLAVGMTVKNVRAEDVISGLFKSSAPD